MFLIINFSNKLPVVKYYKYHGQHSRLNICQLIQLFSSHMRPSATQEFSTLSLKGYKIGLPTFCVVCPLVFLVKVPRYPTPWEVQWTVQEKEDVRIYRYKRFYQYPWGRNMTLSMSSLYPKEFKHFSIHVVASWPASGVTGLNRGRTL